ncbi:nuclear transport factor 2 family protein [Winogradskyella sp.]|uniref:nuclear transport factor 2 family protein n=1 Tax=Winogradskyella sp. TaxID=1883156 RepID=UPI00262B3D8E|nr:nuclear transport factor 2 family protein [Winogradskyella sp.]
MKSPTFQFLILLIIGSSSQLFFAQTSDYAMVEHTINAYLEGDTNKDFETLKLAFHPNATMKYVSSKSGYQEYNALKVFAAEKGREPEKNRTNSIAYISITGKAAHAKLEITYPKRVVVDYVNLLKIDGEWKIVNKIFSLKPNGN